MKIVLFFLLLLTPSISFCQESVYLKMEAPKGHWKIPSGASLQKKSQHLAARPSLRWHSFIQLKSNEAFMVHSFYGGEVIASYPKDEQPFIIIQSGEYFITYVGIENLLLKKGDVVIRNQLVRVQSIMMILIYWKFICVTKVNASIPTIGLNPFAVPPRFNKNASGSKHFHR
ncbi:hypothetical protein [Ferruginibacter sp. HRS2-29]|uniref:hypothetical protein n=1 Tax=Ferruginibacter sp. HRS2-29 TaxID=2487334 RepID=UPI0020CF7EAB|nr:hypothetical protein [Ferruginibacter sp. HRS2-29]MCP9749889.1 hypothetical protein [Ferruginibacter sp. HRS2-29]